MRRRLLFIINPQAGGKLKKKLTIPAITAFCHQNNYDYKIYETSGSGDQEGIKENSVSYSPDAVIAVGGDGTVNAVGEVLVNSAIPMGIIPTGSGNGLAKDLNIPKNINAALEVIRDFHIHAIDTLKVNGRNCFHVCDFGFNARIVRRFSQSITRGRFSYLWFGLQEFFKFRPFEFAIETREKMIKGKAFMMAITNSNRFGTNVNINPLGEIDDGIFEVSIIKPFPNLKSFSVLYHLLNNTIHKTPFNEIIHCTKAFILNKENTSFHIDGEPVHLGEKIAICIVPKGIKMILPCCR